MILGIFLLENPTRKTMNCSSEFTSWILEIINVRTTTWFVGNFDSSWH
jgi:hypothetical protein